MNLLILQDAVTWAVGKQKKKKHTETRPFHCPPRTTLCLTVMDANLFTARLNCLLSRSLCCACVWSCIKWTRVPVSPTLICRASWLCLLTGLMVFLISSNAIFKNSHEVFNNSRLELRTMVRRIWLNSLYLIMNVQKCPPSIKYKFKWTRFGPTGGMLYLPESRCERRVLRVTVG